MFKNYYQVRQWLESFIPQTYTKKELGLERIRHLLTLLDNPQDKFKSIHIAGTSGKGSTAFYIAQLLRNCKLETRFSTRNSLKASNSKLETNHNLQNSNFRKVSDFEFRNSNFKPIKVGLHVSPHLVDIRERMQIFSSPVISASHSVRGELAGIHKRTILDQVENDNSLIPMKLFLELVNEIKPHVESMKSSKVGLPSYFEILVAATFLYFAKEKVDWAVIEVGLGGRLDATNVLKPKLSIITNIGLDHTDILGKTIEKIAFEKAGIIKSRKVREVQEVRKVRKVITKEIGVPVITAATGKALEVIKKVAREKKVPLSIIDTQLGVKPLKSDVKSYVSLYNDILKSSHVFLTKDVFFLSLAAVAVLKIPLNKAKIIEAFSASFPARFEEVYPSVVVDGAHNLEKIKVLVNFFKNQKPETRNQKLTLVCAFKKDKDWKKMLTYLFNNLDIKRCYATQFYSVTDTGPAVVSNTDGVIFFSSVEPKEIAKFIKSKWKVKVESFDNSHEAVFEALRLVESDSTLSGLRLRGRSDSRRSSTHSVNSNNIPLILITGSLYLAGEVRSIWHVPDY